MSKNAFTQTIIKYKIQNFTCQIRFYFFDILLHFILFAVLVFKAVVGKIGETSRSKQDFESIQPKNPTPLPSGLPR